MAIDTKEIIEEELEVPTFKDAKLSDWLEAQPIERFCCGRYRNGENQMCGAGMIADFYGIDWKKKYFLWPGNIQRFLHSKIGDYFPPKRFDKTWLHYGPDAAKQMVVNWVKERGL